MNRQASRVRSFLILSALLTLPPCYAAAQSTAAAIAGTVLDQTSAALPGATVTVKRVETGTTRTMVTDAAGRYRAPQLEPGTYEISAELQGFQTSVRRGLQLALGQEVSITLTLTLGALAEQVVVTEASPLVETTRSTVANLVDEQQIRTLPLNGRDFSELALSGVGVVQSPTTDRSLTRGMGTQFSVAGARPNMVSYLLDGTDIADQGGQSPGSAAGGLLGVDTVREFQVITNNYSAEYGRSAGGIVSAITRSGTNAFHGGAFEFHRNDSLNTRTYFDDPAKPLPPLTRNQYGVNLGGPFRRDKMFFFGGFEGLRQESGRTLVSRVPSGLTRRRADINPLTRPYLLMFPEPNLPETGGASSLYSQAVAEPTTEDYFVVKVDNFFSDKNSGSIRYTFDNANRFENLTVPLFANQHHNRNQYVTLEWKRIQTSSLLNELRGAFNRTFQRTASVDNVSVDPSMFFIPGTQFGALNVTGLETLGTDTSVPYLVGYNVIQLMDALTWTRGAHAVKAGGSWTRWINNQNAAFTIGGNYQFTSIENFVRGVANTFESTLPGFSSERNWRQNMFGFYVQDDWTAASRLTLNLGLRYEFITTPTDTENRVASFRNPPFDAAPTVGNPLFKNPSLRNIAPRLGFAWNATGDGKTSVRGGAGMFYEPILANIYRTFGNRTPPYFAQASVSNPAFPRVASPTSLPTSQQRLDLLQWDLENPYMLQFNLTAQRELLPQFTVMAGYIGSRGIHLFRNVESNQAIPQIQADGSYFFPVGAPRRSPNWAAVRLRRTDGHSWYNGFVSSVTRRFSGGLQFQASYTFGRSFDEGSLSAGSQDFSNGFPPRYADDPHDNYGLSDFDVTHNFTFNYSWSLPLGDGLSGTAKALASGWQVSGIVTLRSGVPFTPVLSFDQARARPRSGGDGQRPSWAPGFNQDNVVVGDPNRYFDPSAFVLPAAGTFGNVERNVFRGPGYAVWNGAVFKNVDIGGQRRLQLRLEVFNLLNRANFALPARTVFSASGRVENAGEITEIVGTARQIQLGVKLEF